MVATPATLGTIKVEALPTSSLVTEQENMPPQADSAALLVLLQAMVAPATGVTPSAATTCTVIGLTVCVPTGVGGFNPRTSTMLSVADAPRVSTFVITDEEPVTGSVIVMLSVPSGCAGTSTIIWPAFISSGTTLTLPTVTVC